MYAMLIPFFINFNDQSGFEHRKKDFRIVGGSAIGNLVTNFT